MSEITIEAAADVGRIAVDQLKQLVPFGALAETHLNDISRKGSLSQHSAGTILFKRDEADERLWFLLDGSLDLADSNFEIKPVVAGDSVAATALDPANPHTMTAITTSPVVVFSLQRDYLDLVLAWDEAGNYVVTDLGDAEDEEVEADWMSCLLQSALFAQIPPTNIQQLFATFEERVVEAGEAVLRQGDVGDYFYVVKSGRAKIVKRMSVDGTPQDLVVAELMAGDVFGEDALIGDAPRNASIFMLTDGSLMRLAKDDFRRLLEQPVLRYVDEEGLAQLREEHDANLQILDVRLPQEFEVGSIEGAVNLPLHLLRDRLDDLDAEVMYVTTCYGGRRGSIASYILNQSGLESVVYQVAQGDS